jgi:CRISPR type III-B/RAMP module RAMP protein Cmr6
MPILMPTDTAALFAASAEKFDSRSLLLDRFVYDHPTMDEARRLHLSRVCEDASRFVQATRAKWQNECRESRNEAERRKLQAYLDDTATLARRTAFVGPAEPKTASESKRTFMKAVAGENEILYAQLQSRLMVNMAGGVMENAGLCLDRFGLPYIPGSAVKGCARRAATQSLLEAESLEAKKDLLIRLCLVFGWGDTDWKAGRKRKRVNGQEVETEPLSDFWWAMALETGNRTEDDLRRSETWRQVAVPVANRLLDQLRMHKREHPDEPWRDLPNFAGSVSFLPAYPVDLGQIGKIDGLPLEVPPLGKLELDVVTCHHRDYYAGKLPIATDTEEPVPVVFPAFAIVPLRGADAQLVQHARTWLATGLSGFGIGAKTAAGYGWFDCCQRVQDTVAGIIQRITEKHRKEQEEAEAKRRAEEAKEAAEKAERDRLANAPPHENFRAEYGKLADEPFATQAKKYHEMTDDQRHGFVLALKERRETAKRWAKKKPELLKPWQEFAQKLQPPIHLP